MPELQRRDEFYSNGLDLNWVLAHRDQVHAYVAGAQALLARMLALPMPTVAALTEHAFGGGSMLAMAHDWSGPWPARTPAP